LPLVRLVAVLAGFDRHETPGTRGGFRNVTEGRSEVGLT
jgi:hypothetical protein